mmetsp:Transcript_14268/g.46865  ORF Transcript_14268/g.46865 Transcript_14268/m.46865 type:complete len:309 (-) Transcript_14268:539-1465(-)
MKRRRSLVQSTTWPGRAALVATASAQRRISASPAPKTSSPPAVTTASFGCCATRSLSVSSKCSIHRAAHRAWNALCCSCEFLSPSSSASTRRGRTRTERRLWPSAERAESKCERSTHVSNTTCVLSGSVTVAGAHASKPLPPPFLASSVAWERARRSTSADRSRRSATCASAADARASDARSNAALDLVLHHRRVRMLNAHPLSYLPWAVPLPAKGDTTPSSTACSYSASERSPSRSSAASTRSPILQSSSSSSSKHSRSLFIAASSSACGAAFSCSSFSGCGSAQTSPSSFSSFSTSSPRSALRMAS